MTAASLNRRARHLLGGAAVVLAGALGLLAAPEAPAQLPPRNDNYLESLQVNAPGTPLPADTVVHGPSQGADTTHATVQADLFAPPLAGGPTEPRRCGARRYGKTVWYDVHANRTALARIVVSAPFDPVLRAFAFDPVSALPGLPGACADRGGPGREVLLLTLLRGRSYTIQLGGARGHGGPYEVRFSFTRLARLAARASLRSRPDRRGIRAQSLRVDAPRGARIRLRCTRGACPSRSRVATAPRGRVARAVRFTLRRRIAAGARIRVTVTRAGAIGRRFEWRVLRGRARRTTSCLLPGAPAPRPCRGL